MSIFLSVTVLASCQKEVVEQPEPPTTVKTVPCVEQKVNPSGRSYVTDSLVEYNCKEKHCGFITLSSKNYWVYQDSIFNDGVFSNVKMDTLRFSKTFMSKQDGLTWWQANKDLGLPKLLYANDSSFFSANTLNFAPTTTTATRSYGLFSGDSIRYMSSFDDVMAMGRSIKLNTSVKVPAGSFNNVLFFEKTANFYGSDELLYKPGVGVLKFTQMRVSFVDMENKKQKVSTLVAYHIE